MKQSNNPRAQAHAILLQVLPGAKQPKSLAFLLDTKQNEGVSPFTQALVYGVCRYFLILETIIKQQLAKALKPKDRDIKILLLMGAFEILAMKKPDHATVKATVELARERRKTWSTGLINAILRTLIKQRKELSPRLDSYSDAYPQWITDLLAQHYSPEGCEHYYQASLHQAPMSLRVNTCQTSTVSFQTRLAEQDIQAEVSPVTPGCLTLKTPLPVKEIPGFAEGACSVQDEAAQWAGHLLSPEPNSRILDACAAPGGKTTHLLELAPEAQLLAIDQSEKRLQQVEENLTRLGLRAELKSGDAGAPDQWWDGNLFDHILIDAPCSGLGVLRRHPDISWLKQSSDLKQFSQTQASILNRLWDTLKPGGTLLYSTCSVLPEENQHIIAQFLDSHQNARGIDLSGQPVAQLTIPKHFTHQATPSSLQNTNNPFGIQIFPETHRQDGFFYAKLTKLAAS